MLLAFCRWCISGERLRVFRLEDHNSVDCVRIEILCEMVVVRAIFFRLRDHQILSNVDLNNEMASVAINGHYNDLTCYREVLSLTYSGPVGRVEE